MVMRSGWASKGHFTTECLPLADNGPGTKRDTRDFFLIVAQQGSYSTVT